MQYSIIVTIVISVTTAMFSSNVSAGNGNFFLGFWEGIDPQDGSSVQLSITDLDRDKEFTIILTDSFFKTCFVAAINTQGRGIVKATGTLKDKFVIESNAEITCVNDDLSDVGPVPFILVISRNSKSDTLEIKFPGAPSILVHRITAPRNSRRGKK